nr:L2 minor capsid protein [Equus caballus papillomavirus 2]
MSYPLPAKRRRRAAGQDLYRACKMGADCIPDVRAKYEQDTVADRILKWLSSFLYLGNLGIGTGRGGTGGRLGYQPVGRGVAQGGGSVRVGTPVSVLEPGVGVETVGPKDLVPVDALGPTTPSVVPLGEGDALAPGVEISAEVHPTFDPTAAGGAGGVSSSGGEAAVLEVPPQVQPRPRGGVSRSQFHNPAFQVELLSSASTGEATGADQVHIFGDTGGHPVGGEEIELDVFSGGDGPRTSTPRSAARAPARRGGLFGRRFTQVPVDDPAFLQDPGRLVEFGFSNPAFDASASLEFPFSDEGVQAAPDARFSNVVHLGRPQFTEQGGGVGVSRVGTRAGVGTRSGVVLREPVHFRYALSSIGPAETIELSDLTAEAAFSVGDTGQGFEEVDLASLGSVVSDNALLDDESLTFNGILSLGQVSGNMQQVPLPDLAFIRPSVAMVDIRVPGTGGGGAGSSVFVDPQNSEHSVFVLTFSMNGLFDLHPSLHPRKRKRRYNCCFADGFLDNEQTTPVPTPQSRL